MEQQLRDAQAATQQMHEMLAEAAAEMERLKANAITQAPGA